MFAEGRLGHLPLCGFTRRRLIASPWKRVSAKITAGFWQALPLVCTADGQRVAGALGCHAGLARSSDGREDHLIRGPDGTMAAARFFGQKPRSMFAAILEAGNRAVAHAVASTSKRIAWPIPRSRLLEDLIVQMAKDNRSWGYDRIAGALDER